MNTHKIIILIGSLFFSCFAIQAQTTIDHWETAVYADDIWYYRLGNVLPPTDWNTNDFDESNWTS
ncbi:MAG: hypothetical protein ACPGXL_03945, partial [Chitinophagales bacterium]